MHVLRADVSDRHPECMWTLDQDPSRVFFNCTWPGTYPNPLLSWAEGGEERGAGGKDHVYVSEETHSLALMLNRSALPDGHRLTCLARHTALPPGTERTCTFTLSESPSPQDGKILNTNSKMLNAKATMCRD